MLLSTRKALLGAGVATLAMALSTQALAQQRQFDIPAQDAATAVTAFGLQADVQISAPTGQLRGVRTPAVRGDMDARAALQLLLAGTGLVVARDDGRTIVLQMDPQGGSAEAGAAVEALIVTAQKREEAIQDVPIAISAFSQKALEEQKIEGGFDLLKAIPNVTFSKTNFSGYNFSIRGIGTKAISATTDPGVAVAFNNTTLIHNRLFEQEYFDVERVEVLRGPQGTLYGRNATSGVINVISAKPDLNDFDGSIKGEVGNYDAKRVVGMINLPIVEDVLAVRAAGSWTQRTGYDYNEITRNNINGRDLWSARVTVGFEPIPQLRANLLWERFEENDDRSRTSKQLCHRDPGPLTVGSFPLEGNSGFNPEWETLVRRSLFSQGCKPGSLYDDAAFGAPNGVALPFIFAPLALGQKAGPGISTFLHIVSENLETKSFLKLADPYRGLQQSRDLRTIASVRNPVYRAKADVFDLSVDFDITDSLSLASQTVYNEDEVFSFQDFNRFNSFPAFIDTSLFPANSGVKVFPPGSGDWSNLTPGGEFCDPQIGCTDRVAGFDISQGSSTQFSQELRLSSDFDGPVNFSIGANYTKFETVLDYYVFYNVITMLALTPPFYAPVDGEIDYSVCALSGFYVNPAFGLTGSGEVPAGDPTANCPYIDPNPINFDENFDGDGHNYFRSKNPYKLESKAAFGEFYWNVNETLKVTAGLRYTDDHKEFTLVPSQVLLAPGVLGGGTVSRGYPETGVISQKWGEWTGRLGFDWKPELDFTDETMLYAFYSHGYKGGGANPPRPGFATADQMRAFLESVASPSEASTVDFYTRQILQLTAVDYGPTFEPEFVDAFEVGSKNTLLNGALTLNTTAFYYDYKDYQVSQIKDRTAVNENFDATIWGLELETVFAPSRDFRMIWNLGYLNTEIANGETSIDIMNRTQGDPNYTLVKPWAQLPSNCVVPTAVAERHLQTQPPVYYWGICGGWNGILGDGGTPIDPNPAFGGGTQPYDYNNYPELNGGAGIRAQLGGNELPNAPHWTTNLGAQYGRDVLDGSWRVTLRGDAYWQSQSWARVYNAVNDKLHGWYNLNVSVRLENADLGLEAEFYVKNLLDKSPITDAFLNSDDTGLTTNVFVLDPRLVGFNVRKTF